MPDAAEDKRTGLLATIENRRACIDAYVRDKTPASTRLSTVSIVSSAIAAALTAGPALGGTRFTDAVQDGLDLESPPTVWRVLCFAALVVSVTAAISANLSKANDLTSRIAAAETSGAMLSGLHTRLKFGRLPTDDAAQEYRDIVTGIPFVPELRTPERARASGRTTAASRRPGLVMTLASAVAAVATLVLLATLVGYGIGLTRSSDDAETPAPTVAPTAPVTPSNTAPTTPSASPTPVEDAGVFAGRTVQGGTSLAIVLGDGRAAAYLCDGEQIEAWLDGTFADGQLDLRSPRGATLTGTVTDEVVFGQVVTPELNTAFRAHRAPHPAGVYEANIQVNGGPARVGWAVLPDATQVGIVNSEGVRTRAPHLDTGDLSFTYQGAEHRAVRKDA